MIISTHSSIFNNCLSSLRSKQSGCEHLSLEQISTSPINTIKLGVKHTAAWSTIKQSLGLILISYLVSLFPSAIYGQGVEIQKSVSASAVNPESAFTYTIKYSCTSITDPCQNVVITDKLPQGMRVVDLASQIGTTSYDATTQIATFTLGTLPAGTTGEVQIKLQATGNVPGGTVLPNSATITSGGTSIVSNSVSTTVNTQQAIALQKLIRTFNSVGSNIFPQGSNGYYSISVSNIGNTSISNFCVEDTTLPIPDKLKVTAIQTGQYSNYFGATNPETVTVSYKTNLNTSYQDLSGSPFSTSVSSSVIPTLAADEYITAVRWCFNGTVLPGFNEILLPTIFVSIATDAPLGDYQNCATLSQAGTTFQEVCPSFTVKTPVSGAITSISKTNNSTSSLPPGDTVTNTVTINNLESATQGLQNGSVHDGFQTNYFEYVPNSWTYTGPGTPPTFTKTQANGSTYLNWALTSELPVGGQMQLSYKLIVKNTAPSDTLSNRVLVNGSNIYSCSGQYIEADRTDLDQDGDFEETVCIGYAATLVSSSALLKSEKLVKGQLDAAYSKYPAYGQTVPGGQADYRLRISNAGNVPMKNIVIIDILPFIGDKGVLDTQDRLTEWRPNLAGPVTPPAGVSVYYSNQSNPCRPELNFSPAGCTTANWSTVPPTDITTVQSLKFDFGSIVIQPGDSLFLAWPMRAPTDAPTSGEIAWNSFGYIATRNDNNVQLLAAEPIKVGIKVNPLIPAVYGDFVWLDTDKDGVQDTGEPGISGVRVELYKDNGDGVSDKNTDTYVGFTVTGANGRYLFSGLEAGDYYAIFYPPSGYSISPTLAGSDPSVDSEGTIAAVTHLDAGETDLTWDLGIFPSTACNVQITNITVSDCNYSGGVSRATVNVFVTWANAPAGQDITVSLAGATAQTIDVTGAATSPVLVSFTIAADGANHAITAGFATAGCQDNSSILSPQPCVPAVCSIGLTNVLIGACTGTKRQVNAKVSWSNGPQGENIIVTWDGVPVDTILVSGGLGSPQPTSFYVAGGTGSHTLSAKFASTTACSTSVSNLTVAACALPCNITVNATSATICAGQTGTLTASGATTYLWSNGATGSSITVSVAGTYSVTGTSAGCTDIATGTVTVNPAPTVNVISISICAGQTGTLTVSGADTYLWSNGATGSSISVSVAGTYSVTGTTTGGCIGTATGTVTINPVATLNVTSATVCQGQTGTLTASGATTYLWSNGATTASINVSVAGTYSVTGNSGSGCTGVGTGTLTVSPTPTVNVTSANICAGQTGTLTASGADTYLWSNGSTGSSITVSVAGTYSVTGTSAGCTDIATGTVTVNPAPTVNVTSTTICAGQTGTLTASGATTYLWSNGATGSSITVSVAGTYSVTGTSAGCTGVGTGTLTVSPAPTVNVTSISICAGQTGTLTVSGADTYLWSNGATGSSISVSVAGTYSVTGTTTGGCIGTATGTVTINPVATLNVTSATVCQGQTGTLTASGADTYLWSNGATTASISVNVAGTYSVTGNSGSGCTGVGTGTLTVTPPPTVNVSSISICAGQTGTLTASGADTYLWSNGATGSSISVSVAGTYSVTGTTGGCSDVATATVTINPVATLNVTSATVCQGQTGTLTASGADTYLWSNGATTASISVNVAGTYSVTGNSGSGCTGVGTGTLTVNPGLTVNVTSATLCGGLPPTKLTASGADTYLWSNGATGSSINVSVAGTYSVTGTSASGCTGVGTGTLTVNPAPTVNVTSATICEGQTGTLTASGADTYRWDNGATTATTASINVSVAGTYFVVGTTTSTGCTFVATGTLTVNPNPTVNVSSISICAGQTGTLTASGATTYLWSNGATGASINVSVAGTYSVTGTTGGCTDIATGTVTINPVATLNVTSATVCQGQIGTLIASGASTYLWSNGATTASISVNVAGTYSVTGNSGSGCTGVGTGTLTVNPPPTVNVTSISICAGQTGTLTASGATTYLWSNGATGSSITVSVAGTYSVTGTSAGGCTDVATGTVTVNPAPTVNVTSTNICAGQTGTLTASGASTYLWSNGATTASISVNVAGTYSVTGTTTGGCVGTATGTVTINQGATVNVTSANICGGQTGTLTASGADTYLWSNGSTGSSISVSVAGTYSVTGTITGGCIGTATGTVTVNPAPTVNVTSATVCQGQIGTLIASGASTYLWSNGATTAFISVNVAGTYSVTGTSAGGCTDVGTGTLTVNPNPTVNVTSISICAGQTGTLTASGATTYLWSNGATGSSITVSVAGTYSVTGTTTGGCVGTATGTVTINPVATLNVTSATVCQGQIGTLIASGASTYLWSNGATTASISVNVAGTYSVTGNSGSGCTGVGSGTLTVTPPPTVNVTSISICAGQTGTLTASGATTYQWSNGATGSSITVNVAGTYSVTGTTAGCSDVATATVTINPVATLNVTSATVCQGQIGTLIASGATTYLWSNGATTASISVNVAGTYSVTGNSGSGCTGVGTSTLTVTPPPTVNVTSISICAGQTGTLTASGADTYLWSNGATGASINVSVAGTYSVTGTTGGCTDIATGTVTINPVATLNVTSATVCQGQIGTLIASGASTYLWSNGATTAFISVNVAGTYSVTGNSGSGCTGVGTGTLTVNPPPTVNVTSISICAGQTGTLTASGATTYLWSNGATGSSITVSVAGTYSVTGTSAGCSDVATGTVTVNPAPTVNVTSTNICAGQTGTLTASGASTYLWSNGATTASISVNVAGTYSVTGTTTGGCVGTATGTVTINQGATVNVTSANICGGQTGTLTASGADTYLWSNGSTGSSISVSVAGTYSVTGTITGGCIGTATGTVTVNPAPTVNVTSATVCQGQIGTLIASGASTYLWSNGATTAFISVNVAGTYSVTGTSAGGCTDVGTGTLTVNPNPTVNVTSISICAGQTGTLTASGATTYLWSNGATGSSITVSVAGTYSVTGTTTGGCVGTATGTVTINPVATLNVTSATVCQGQIGTLIASGASTYLWSNGATTASISVNVAGTYSVTGNSGSGCTGVGSGTLTVNPNPTVNVTSISICAGQTGTLTASGATTYLWSNGATTASISVSVAGTYSVTGTSAGCTDLATGTLTISPAPNAALTVPAAALCAGQSTTLTATGGTSYAFSTGTINTTGLLIVSPTTTTTYSVTVASASGCRSTTSVTVTVNGQPQILSIDQASTCVGGTASFTVDATNAGSGTLEYSLNGGSFTTANSFTINAPTSTTATIVVRTQGSSCSDSQTIVLNCACQTPVSLTLLPASPQVCAGSALSLTATLAGVGSASLTSSGTGVFSQSSITGTQTLTYQPSAADIQAGSVTLRLATADPDGSGSCGAAAISRVLTISGAPSLSITASSAGLCAGQTAMLTASGANTYLWSNGATTATTSVSVAGPYSVTGISSAGCSATATTTLTVSPAPTVNVTSISICAGQTGTLTASGATTYQWSNGATGSSITVSVAGTYSVTGTTAGGCSDVATGTVTINPVATLNVTSATVCQGQIGTLIASGASTYLWSNGATTASISVSVPGTYSVTGNSGSGCTGVGSGTLTVNPPPTVNVTSISICAGQTGTLTASGATTYLWSNGATGSSITVNVAGTYSVTGTTGGCSDVATATVTINPVATLNVTSATVCQGQIGTLIASGASTYQWSNGATTASISVSVAGTYSVTGNSGSGCTGVGSGTLTVTPPPTVNVTSISICAGQTGTLTASGATTYLWSNGSTGSSITVSVAGTYSVTGTTGGCSDVATATVTINPVATLNVTSATVCQGQIGTLIASGASTYLWSNGATTASISVSVAGTYSVTGNSGSGCTGVGSGTLTVTPPPTVNVTSISICAGQTGTLTASGATTYLWSNGSTGSSITVSVAGTYSVTGTTGGCSDVATATVTINPVATLNVTSATVCQGQIGTLIASGASTYLWSNGATTASISVNVAGTYSVTGTSAGCTDLATGTLTISPAPNAALTVPAAALCAGQSTTLTATGGTSYAFSTGTINTTGLLIVSPTTTTTYSVTVASASGCRSTTSVTVTVNGQPQILSIDQASTCVGGTASFTVDATNAGSGTLEYSLNGGSFTTANSFTINAPTSTTATIVVRTQGSSCSDSQTIVLNCACQTPVSLTLLPASPQVCAGSALSLTATLAGAASASLTSSGTGVFSQSSITGTQTLTYQPSAADIQAGSVTLRLATADPDGSGSCGAAAISRVLTISGAPSLSITASSAGLCAGQTAMLTASGANTYLWSNGATTATTSVSVAGTYSVTGISSAGCSATATTTLTVSPAPTVNVTSISICAGQTGTLTASGANTYLWSNGATTASISVSVAGTYSVTGTTAGGCSDVATGTVTINPVATLNVTSATVCQGQIGTLIASGASTYLWSNGATTASISVSVPGTYSVTGNSGSGCTGVGSGTLTVSPRPIPSLSSATICAGQSVTLIATGGTSYSFSQGTTNSTGVLLLTPDSTTAISVTVANASGCVSSTSATVTVNPLPDLLTNVVCNGTTTYNVAFTATAGASVSASVGTISGNMVTGVPSGQQLILTVSLNGCSVSTQLTQNCQSNLAGLGDFVWNDTNKDGSQDAGEAPIQGVVATLFINGVSSATTLTNATGFYSFTGLTPGSSLSYSVGFTAPAGFTATGQNLGGDDTKDSDANPATGRTQAITLTAGEFNPTLDAGFVTGLAGLGDFVWNDTNKDGSQDAGEAPIQGVVATLFINGVSSATTLTNATGFYSFTGLTPGSSLSYSVGFTAPTGFTATGQNLGGDDTKDSDANPATGRTQAITLVAGEFNPTLDAGFVTGLAGLGDFVWNDTNKDGSQDAGEAPIQGVVATLFINGVSSATTLTNATGFYSFTGLTPGSSLSYSVGFTAPTGFTATGQNLGGDDTKDSDANPATGRTQAITLTAGEFNPTLDAGFVTGLAGLGDFVWNDTNKDGSQDAGEAPIQGVVATLFINGVSSATTLTNATGFYSFTGLTPGSSLSYSVGFTAPTGFTATGQNLGGDDTKDSDANPATGRTQAITLVAGEFNPTLDAGFVTGLAGLGDFVWNDTNKDGSQDAGEAPIQGVVATLFINGVSSATTLTNATGFYSFTGLTPGSSLSYSVGFTAPAGFTATGQNLGGDDTKDSDANPATGRTQAITLVAGEFNPTLDAGFVTGLAGLGDFVWNDTNKDGSQDAGEAPIQGVVATLFINGVSSATTLTNATGFYSFTGLTPGSSLSYSVGFTAPAGFTATGQNLGGDDTKDSDANPATGKTQAITLTAGEFNPTLDAGFVTGLAGLGDFVWNDTNKDGSQDAGEAPIQGVVATLFINGVSSATTLTNATGFYSFTGLTPGSSLSYSVGFTAPAGFTATGQNLGGDDTKDSDANPATGRTQAITLVAGEFNPTLDAGFVTGLAGLGDFVWNDTNKDGSQDAGEAPIQGVVATLFINGVSSATTLTNATGFYSFTGLTPGSSLSYSVGFTAPAGFTATGQNLGGDDTKDSDANPATGRTQAITLTAGEFNPTLDAGFVTGLAGLGDFVWNDTNKDGSQDAGEAPIQGVVATLFINGVSSATTLTNATGFYSFTGLTPGSSLSYSVGFTAPTGFTATGQNLGGDDTKDSDANPATGKTQAITLTAGEFNPTLDAGFSGTNPELRLEKRVDKTKASVGDVLSYSIVLTNIGTAVATNVLVSDSASTGLSYVLNSATVPVGTTFTQGTPTSLWKVASLNAGQSLTLTFQAKADTSGILRNRAIIPGDTATVCTSIPVKVCAGKTYTFRLTAPTGRSSYQWFKDGILIQGQTTNVLNVTTPGSYSLAADNTVGSCTDFSCCPFIVEEDPSPTFQALATRVTCIKGVAQANGQIKLSGFNSTYTYQYSAGSSFNSVASLSGAPQVIPVGGLIVNNLTNPVSDALYTVRVYNTTGCYTDVTVSLLPTVCDCPTQSCTPLIISQTKKAKRIGK
jgi:fimbrial isopeptide formation D2 family protein